MSVRRRDWVDVRTGRDPDGRLVLADETELLCFTPTQPTDPEEAPGPWS